MSEPKYCIKDLSEGRVAVVNDGTAEQLKQVISSAFPGDVATFASSVYYFKHPHSDCWTDQTGKPNLPTQSVANFLVATPSAPASIEQGDEDVWEEVFKHFNEMYMSDCLTKEEFTGFLKSKYIINKIK